MIASHLETIQINTNKFINLIITAFLVHHRYNLVHHSYYLMHHTYYSVHHSYYLVHHQYYLMHHTN